MNLPSANIGPRADSRVRVIGQAAGIHAAYSSAVIQDQAPMLKARCPSLPCALSCACSRNISCGDLKSKPE
jgi:hypothetical protein